MFDFSALKEYNRKSTFLFSSPEPSYDDHLPPVVRRRRPSTSLNDFSKPLGQFSLNFMWNILGIENLYKWLRSIN